MPKKIIIAAGGTGGHLFPAQSLARDLKNKIEVVFVGSKLSKNPFFEKEDFSFFEVESSNFSKKNNPLKSLFKLLKGTFQSLKILKREKPDLIIGFGSFHSFPVLLAALLTRKKLFLHEQNKQMGLVNRIFAKKAKKIFTTFPNTFPSHVSKHHLVEMPLRFKKQNELCRKEILKSLNLNPNLKTVLVTGGSQGAHFINKTFIQSVSAIDKNAFQVIHLVGKNDDVQEYQEVYKQYEILAYVKPFESKMDSVLHSSDFALTRAGASSISEMLEFEIPALMIPYPYAKNHQEHNANFFEKEVKGGVLLRQKDLSKELFVSALKEFFKDEKIKAYRHDIKTYKAGQKRDFLTELLLKELES